MAIVSQALISSSSSRIECPSDQPVYYTFGPSCGFSWSKDDFPTERTMTDVADCVARNFDHLAHGEQALSVLGHSVQAQFETWTYLR